MSENKMTYAERHPDFVMPEPIESLNLVMKKENALAILNGTKKVEYRAYSAHYCTRLIDAGVTKYMKLHAKDKDIDEVSPMRPVYALHFHDYNNSWFLDVECVENGWVGVNDEGVRDMQDTFGCHELDAENERLNAIGETKRPIYFYFAVGKVIGTNLQQ